MSWNKGWPQRRVGDFVRYSQGGVHPVMTKVGVIVRKAEWAGAARYYVLWLGGSAYEGAYNGVQLNLLGKEEAERLAVLMELMR